MLTLDSAYKFMAKDYKETLIFCVLAAIAMVIPLFGALLLMGLYIRIVSNSINQKDEIPKVFGKFGQDVMNGLKQSLFMAILMIPFIAIFAGSFSGMAAAAISQDISGFADAVSGMGFLWVLLLILIIAYALIVPALTANFAREQRFGAFFEINKAFGMVFGNFKAYLKMIGINILYAIAISAISGILSFTILVPIILSQALILVNGKVLGDWYKEVSKK